MSALPHPPRARTWLGGHATLTSRVRVFLSAEGIEVEEHTGLITDTRTRILFDEVQLVTLDRRRSSGGLWVLISLALLIALITAVRTLNRNASPLAFLAGALFFTSPLWLYVGVKYLAGTDFITVFGKRSYAQISFAFRKQRAVERFALVCDTVREKTQSARPTPEEASPSAAAAASEIAPSP